MLVMTQCPEEFKCPKNARIKWVALDLNKPYDFLLGMDWIGTNCENINISKQEIH